MTKRSSRPDHADRTLRLGDEEKPFRDEVVRSVKAQFRPALVVLSGSRVGDRISIEGNVLIGRDPTAELTLHEAGVSWHHAQIEDRGGSFTVVDAGSTNGTGVNGRLMQEAELRHGDKLAFGATVVRFEMQDESDQAFDEFVSRLVSIDDLTGLYLRRRFDQELKELLAVARLNQQPVALLVMDLDGVKGINDQHGHRFGAYTISDAGRVIGRVIGRRGFACRWGGDEFLAALKRTDREGGCRVAEEILSAIGDHAFENDGVQLHPGISIGVAGFPEDAEDQGRLFDAADAALYRAKRSGKNRVCV
ncbi:MAG: GGDEF domain-containing protein [Myxococcota bacterium]